MKKALRFVPVVARVLLGLLFTVTGLNGFLNFIPEPTDPMPEGAVAFAGALQSSGYMFPMIMGTQLVCGVLLLTGLFVPLALVLLVEVYLVWAYRKAFGPMLAWNAKPAGR